MLRIVRNQGALRGLGESELSRVVGSLTKGARSTVQSVTIRSNVSPDIYLSSLEAVGPSGGGVRRQGGFSEAMMAALKPEIEMETVAGRVRLAPWGPPTTNLFWPIVIVGTAGLGALVILAVRGARGR